jgi:acyl phosphate:glycerol-3-phosphate acyltransferase
MNQATLLSAMTTLSSEPLAWAAIVGAYLLGSVPFGLLIARRVKGVDLRRIGSGNIGASNAVRAMGRKWGLSVFALDFLKGWAPVLAVAHVGFAREIVPLLQVLVGTAAVLGHCYSIYLRFTGGKGVATGCGAIVAIEPLVFVAGGLVWLLVRYTTRYLGLASILMGATFPLAAWALDDTRELVVGSSLLTVLILVRHRSNIRRMLAGTEPRAGEKTDPTEIARPHV